MELTSFFGRTAKRITTHYNPKTNADAVVFTELKRALRSWSRYLTFSPAPPSKSTLSCTTTWEKSIHSHYTGMKSRPKVRRPIRG